ncbi:MAG: ABC transporter permease [Desulfosporosinus sp.]|nr:ABC transporter permease [Desulfosporosinus sp.]
MALPTRFESVPIGLSRKPKFALAMLSATGLFAAKLSVLILFWQGIVLVVHSVFIPSPVQVWNAFWRLTLQGDMQGYTLFQAAWVSLLRVLRGFGLALLAGIPIGVIFGLWNKVYTWVKPLVEPVRFIPPLAWVPLVIILLKGENRYTFIIWIGAVFPILITTMSGVNALEKNCWEVGQVLGASRWQAVTKLVIPAAAPHMFAGARLGLGVGWACIVAAEMIGGGVAGLGNLIINYGQLLQIDAVVAVMIVIGVLGYLLNEILILAEKKLFPWRRDIKF